MTKAMAIQLIRYYVDEHLHMYTDRNCPPMIFEERSYKRSAALELVEYIRNESDRRNNPLQKEQMKDPYRAVGGFKLKNLRAYKHGKHYHEAPQLIRAYKCNYELASDILEIMEAMEDEYEYERMGFGGA